MCEAFLCSKAWLIRAYPLARRPSRVSVSLLDIDLPGFYPAVYPCRESAYVAATRTASLGPDTR
jgi:hypothetical protein